MGEAQLITLVMQGGFTALAAFLVWRLARTSEADHRAAQERETRMDQRIDTLEHHLVELTAQSIRAQNDLSSALRDLTKSLERRPCLTLDETKHVFGAH